MEARESYAELFFLLLTKIKYGIISVCKHLTGKRKDSGARLFSLVSHDRTRGCGHELKYRRFHLNLNYFEDGQTLAQDESSSLEVFKTQLGCDPGQPAVGGPAFNRTKQSPETLCSHSCSVIL